MKALGLGCLGGTSTPQTGRHRGQPFSVPLPISVSLAFPGCLVVLVPLPVGLLGRFLCPGSPGEAPQILHSRGWHRWSRGDMALSCGQHRVPLLGCLLGTACRSHPQVCSGTGM